MVFPNRSYAHIINNVWVNFKEGDNFACLATYVLAEYCPSARGTEPDGPKYLLGEGYSVNWERTTVMDYEKSKNGFWTSSRGRVVRQCWKDRSENTSILSTIILCSI
jgi:hypothetical protein